MSSRVLLVDDVSTSRIILKVKLSAAYYTVTQAASLEDARASIAVDSPDLILVSSRLVKDDMARAIAHLKQERDGAFTPIILLTEHGDKSLNISALTSGFADVLDAATPENYLLARLRGLLRQGHFDQDLRKHALAARALGLAESQQAFSRPAVITLVTDDPATGIQLRNALSRDLPHGFQIVAADKLMSPETRSDSQYARSDVLIADLRHMVRDDALRLIADLRASVGILECPVLPLLADQASDLAANLLDMGVKEILFGDTDPREMALRLDAQLDHEWAKEEVRSQINDSLQAAVTDPLTGLYNRRYALSFLKCLLSPDGQEGGMFAVMVADLDHFKRINDSFGHAAGDTVLAQVSNTLCDHLQGKDLVARIGGEEFLIIIPETNRGEAHRIAKTLCEAVRSISLTLPGHGAPVPVTVSIGVTLANATLSDDQNHETRAKALLEQADRALYASKADGRNTVTLNARSAA